MALQKAMEGTDKIKRNSWCRGNGPCSFRGELRGGISKKKKVLNRKVRHRFREEVFITKKFLSDLHSF